MGLFTPKVIVDLEDGSSHSVPKPVAEEMRRYFESHLILQAFIAGPVASAVDGKMTLPELWDAAVNALRTIRDKASREQAMAYLASLDTIAKSEGSQ